MKPLTPKQRMQQQLLEACGRVDELRRGLLHAFAGVERTDFVAGLPQLVAELRAWMQHWREPSVGTGWELQGQWKLKTTLEAWLGDLAGPERLIELFQAEGWVRDRLEPAPSHAQPATPPLSAKDCKNALIDAICRNRQDPNVALSDEISRLLKDHHVALAAMIDLDAMDNHDRSLYAEMIGVLETPPNPAEPNPAAAEKLCFSPGAFSYCGGPDQQLTGKPLQVLKALYSALKRTLTLDELRSKFWSDTQTGNETIKSAVSTARNALRAAIAAAGEKAPEDPIPNVERGTGLTA